MVFTQVVTTNIEVEARALLSQGYQIVSKDALIIILFTKQANNPMGKYIYVTFNSDDAFYFSLKSDIIADIVILTSVVIDNSNIKTIVKYKQPNEGVELYHLPDNISIDRVPKSIDLAIENAVKNIKAKKIGVICPGILKPLITSKSRFYFIESNGRILEGTDFIIDTMLTDDLKYVTLGLAIIKFYNFANNVPKGVFLRLMSEGSFSMLPTGKNVSTFELYLPILNYLKDDISEYFLTKYDKSNDFPYGCNFFPAVIHSKFSDKNYEYNLIASIVSTILDESDFVFNFIDYNLTYEDSHFDFLNKTNVSKFLYSKYGESTSLLFYINILIEFMNVYENFGIASISDFAEKHYIDKPTLYHISTKINQFMLLNIKQRKIKDIKPIDSISEDSEIYKQINYLITNLYENEFILIENKYINSSGDVFMVDDDRVIHNWNKPLPQKIIPLVIKSKFIYLWTTSSKEKI